MKRKINFLLVLVITFFAGVIIMEKLDKREFRFEDFKSSNDLENFLNKTYPVGTDWEILFKNLQLAGAECQILTKKDDLPNGFEKYEDVVWCDYITGWFSWPPKEHFQVIIMGNKYKKISKFSISKYCSLVI